MTRKISIRNAMRAGNRSAGEGAVQCRSNRSSGFANSNDNDSSLSAKIRIILAAFVLLEVLDAALTFLGISQHGLGFEKNGFIREYIAGFGFLPVAAAKIGISALFALLINSLYLTLNRKTALFYLSALLMLIAFYGVGSNIYALLF